jgi:Antitoxin Xre/MbcA/ParS C-terminal toxin-binding domain/Antitoxin Xre-like helix-turn-helix domain
MRSNPAALEAGASAGSQEAAVATKALLRAAERLGLSNRALARIVGLSEASVSRMGTGAYALQPGDKAFELALLFIRLFRSLDSIVGGDEALARAWLRNDNTALGEMPLALIETVSGLVNVLAYLDARRALV